MGPGNGDDGWIGGFIFLAESCNLVFTTSHKRGTFSFVTSKLTPDGICPGRSHDTRYDCCTEVYYRAVFRRLTSLCSRGIRELFGEIVLGCGVEVEVDGSGQSASVFLHRDPSDVLPGWYDADK